MELNQHNLSSHVDRFWKGDTSLEEERALREYFQYADVPEAYTDVAAYLEMSGDDLEVLGDAFDERVLSLTVGKSSGGGRLRSLAFLGRAAAMVAVVLGVWFVTSMLEGPHDQPLAATNAVSLQHADPEVKQAFQQLKDALSLVSGKMHQGAEHSNKLLKINHAVDVPSSRSTRSQR